MSERCPKCAMDLSGATLDAIKPRCTRCGYLLEPAQPAPPAPAAPEGVEQWLARSRKLNPDCGCDQRGGKIFSCSYHEGAADAWDDAVALGQTFCTAHDPEGVNESIRQQLRDQATAPEGGEQERAWKAYRKTRKNYLHDRDSFNAGYSAGQTFCTAHTQVYQRVHEQEKRLFKQQEALERIAHKANDPDIAEIALSALNTEDSNA